MRPFLTSGYHRQPQKSGAKIHFSNRHPLIPTASTNAFHSINLFLFFTLPSSQVPTNSVAPSSVYKAHTTHNSSICSDEGLTLETSAFQSLYGGQFTLSTLLINQIFVIIIWPNWPCKPFFSKPLMKVLYKGRTRSRKGSEKAVWPYYKSVWPRALKFQAVLSPNWSYDKMIKYLWTKLGQVERKIFGSWPSHSVNKYIVSKLEIIDLVFKMVLFVQQTERV